MDDVRAIGDRPASRPDAPDEIVGAPIRNYETGPPWPRQDTIRNEVDARPFQSPLFAGLVIVFGSPQPARRREVAEGRAVGVGPRGTDRRRRIESDLDALADQMADHGTDMALESTESMKWIGDSR